MSNNGTDNQQDGEVITETAVKDPDLKDKKGMEAWILVDIF